jgi:hypothetical protein
MTPFKIIIHTEKIHLKNNLTQCSNQPASLARVDVEFVINHYIFGLYCGPQPQNKNNDSIIAVI